MRTGNPALKAFNTYADTVDGYGPRALDDVVGKKARSTTMTLRGTIIATSVLVGLCAASAFATFPFFDTMLNGDGGGSVWTWLMGLFAATFGLAIFIGFKPKTARYLGPVYAIGEGSLLALFSLVISHRYLGKFDPHLISYGIIGTFSVAAALCAAYSLGLIRIGGTAMKVIVVAISAVALYALSTWVFSLLGMNVPNLFASTGPWGIGFTGLCIVLASAALILDFQFIESGIKGGAPKHMEWYAGFSILVTLAWLYIEILRLLAKLAPRD